VSDGFEAFAATVEDCLGALKMLDV